MGPNVDSTGLRRLVHQSLIARDKIFPDLELHRFENTGGGDENRTQVQGFAVPLLTSETS